jgi:hypothetical protein
MKSNCRMHGEQDFIVVYEGKAYCPLCAEEMNKAMLDYNQRQKEKSVERKLVPPQQFEDVSMGTSVGQPAPCPACMTLPSGAQVIPPVDAVDMAYCEAMEYCGPVPGYSDGIFPKEEGVREAELQNRRAGLFDMANWCREWDLELRTGVHRASRQKVQVTTALTTEEDDD